MGGWCLSWTGRAGHDKRPNRGIQLETCKFFYFPSFICRELPPNMVGVVLARISVT